MAKKSRQYMKDAAKKRANNEAKQRILKALITPRKLGLKNQSND